MEFSVTMTITTDERLTEEVLFDVAAIGGAASGEAGGHDLSTTMTVQADDVLAAASGGLAKVETISPGAPVAVEVLTIEEADRRLAGPAFPELVGLSEIADILGVTRQRVSKLRNLQSFPGTVAELRAGSVWLKSDLSRFCDGWERKVGRPWPACTEVAAGLAEDG
jgi:hypothetical protein